MFLLWLNVPIKNIFFKNATNFLLFNQRFFLRFHTLDDILDKNIVLSTVPKNIGRANVGTFKTKLNCHKPTLHCTIGHFLFSDFPFCQKTSYLSQTACKSCFYILFLVYNFYTECFIK